MPSESQDSQLTMLPDSMEDTEIAAWIVPFPAPARRSTREPQPTVQHAEGWEHAGAPPDHDGA